MHKQLFRAPQSNEFLQRTGKGPLAPWSTVHALGTDMAAWDRILTECPADLLPMLPFERSRFRDGGYAMWDLIAGGGASGFRRNVEGAKMRIRMGAPSRGTNTARKRMWELYAHNELHASRHVLQVSDRSAWMHRLDRAHTMAHAVLDARWRPSTLESSLCHGGREFMQAFAELAVAELYRMPVRADRPHGGLTRLPYGVYVSATTCTNFMSPAPAMFPFDKKLDLVDKVFAVVHVMVEVGADPVAMVLPGAKPSPWSDQWAGVPVRAIVIGWETADWFGAQDVGLRPYTAYGEPHGELVFYSHPDDLMPPDTFGFYLDAAEKESGMAPDTRTYVRPETMGSAEPAFGVMLRTPLTPCHICMLRNRDVTEHSERPDYKVPQGWKNDPAWVAYFRRMKSIIRCAAGSSAVYEPRLRRVRAARARSRSEYMKTLKRREMRKYGSLPKRHT